ncbi:MAG: ROK family protein [Sedimentisphaerales bacterium]|nr:ROK family protein [Sedimentisphaerales bacterium]
MASHSKVKASSSVAVTGRSDVNTALFTPKKHAKFRGSLKALRILDQQGPLAQTHIAQDLGVSPPAALGHFRKLDKEGLVVAVDKKATAGRGRPLELWDVDRQRNFTIGIVFTPPEVNIAMADFADNIVLQQAYDVGAVETCAEVEALIEGFVVEANEYLSKRIYDLRFACACLPGPVNMPIMPQIDIEGVFRRHEIPAIRTPISTAMLFGEARRFPAESTVCVVDWESGIAVIPCCGDRVLFGDESQYTSVYNRRKICDFGHQRIVKDGRPCPCGNRGCLEAYAGGRAIIQQLNRPNIRSLSDLCKAAQSGDAEVLRELALAARYIGSALSQFVLLMGIDKIVITGPLSEVFSLVRQDFNDGLRGFLDEPEVENLQASVSPDPLGLLVKGSCRAARHLFLNSDLPLDITFLPKIMMTGS